MNHLDRLESQSIFVIREAFNKIDRLALLWSAGKDSQTLLWLVRKAFFGHVPFPCVFLETGFDMPELVELRDRLTREWRLDLIVARHDAALAAGMNHTRGRVTCCSALLKDNLKQIVERERYGGLIVGVRRDEDPTRAKERYFSPRDAHMEWHVDDQPPELWDQCNTDLAGDTHLRVHPLLHWAEADIWEYAGREAHSQRLALFRRRRPPLPIARLRAVHVQHRVPGRFGRGHPRGALDRQDERTQRARSGPGKRRSLRASAPRRVHVGRCPWPRTAQRPSQGRRRRPRRSRQVHPRRAAGARHRGAARREVRGDQGLLRQARHAVRVGLPDGRPAGGTRPEHLHRDGADLVSHGHAPVRDHRRARPQGIPQEHGHGRRPRADAALLLVDAVEGVQEQSRRHGYLLSLLGIRQVAVLVNKMDLAGYREDAFQKAADEYRAFLGRSWASRRTQVIPIAAATGDNVARPSAAHALVPGPHRARGARRVPGLGAGAGSAAAVSRSGRLPLRPPPHRRRPHRGGDDARRRHDRVFAARQGQHRQEHRELARRAARVRRRRRVHRHHAGRAGLRRSRPDRLARAGRADPDRRLQRHDPLARRPHARGRPQGQAQADDRGRRVRASVHRPADRRLDAGRTGSRRPPVRRPERRRRGHHSHEDGRSRSTTATASRRPAVSS